MHFPPTISFGILILVVKWWMNQKKEMENKRWRREWRWRFCKNV